MTCFFTITFNYVSIWLHLGFASANPSNWVVSSRSLWATFLGIAWVIIKNWLEPKTNISYQGKYMWITILCKLLSPLKRFGAQILMKSTHFFHGSYLNDVTVLWRRGSMILWQQYIGLCNGLMGVRGQKFRDVF